MCFDDCRFTLEHIKVLITVNSDPFNNKYHQPPPNGLNNQSFSFVMGKRKRSSGNHNKTKCTSFSGNVSVLLLLEMILGLLRKWWEMKGVLNLDD